jgi:hypothetical protein
MAAHRFKGYFDDFVRREYCIECSAEGRELTTDCPGTTVDPETRRRVALGELDFRNGAWLDPRPTTRTG